MLVSYNIRFRCRVFVSILSVLFTLTGLCFVVFQRGIFARLTFKSLPLTLSLRPIFTSLRPIFMSSRSLHPNVPACHLYLLSPWPYCRFLVRVVYDLVYHTVTFRNIEWFLTSCFVFVLWMRQSDRGVFPDGSSPVLKDHAAFPFPSFQSVLLATIWVAVFWGAGIPLRLPLNWAKEFAMMVRIPQRAPL